MTFTDLIHQPYDVFLFDAYGVLVNSSGAIPGAAAALDRVRAAGRNYFVLTNDASRTPLAASLFYQKCGLQIQPSQIVTAGLAIEAALREIRNLNGLSRSLVMGTADTVAMVQNAGHQIIEIDAHADFDVLVIGDDSGFDLLVSLNAIISALHRLIKAGRRPRLLLGNSDLLYPKSADSFGFTSGAIARLIEAALDQLHPELAMKFEVLGKPSRAIFDLALSIAGCQDRSRAIMFGDQLHTDIAGANLAGIASVLVGTGITSLPLPTRVAARVAGRLATEIAKEQTPTFVMQNLL